MVDLKQPTTSEDDQLDVLEWLASEISKLSMPRRCKVIQTLLALLYQKSENKSTQKPQNYIV